MWKFWNEGIESFWRPSSQRQTRPAEPTASVLKAMNTLGRLSARGVAIPENLKATVLAAQQELANRDGTLSCPTGVAFYAAYRELALLLARADENGDVSLADPYARAVVNSEYLMKFASENGTNLPPDVQASLIAGQARMGVQPDDATKANFYNAYAVLAKMLGNVTADTIKACRSPITRRTLKRDERKAIGLALFTVSISVLLFTAEAINTQLTQEITRGNELAIKLRGTVFPTMPSGVQPAPVRDEYVHDPCTALNATPGRDDFQVKTQADLDQIQAFAIALRGAHTRANKLNSFILFSECDPFGLCWWWNGTHNSDKMFAANAKPSIRDRLELSPTLSNYTAEFLCKVQAWQEVRNYAANIQNSYGATFGGLVAHALPILYALLGAYAYRLRQFSETVRNRTFHPSFADSARLITAIIAGAVAGLFNPIKDLSVPPLAVAFLVGYGVEIFFRFLDSMLTSFGSTAPGVMRPVHASAPVAATAAREPPAPQTVSSH